MPIALRRGICNCSLTIGRCLDGRIFDATLSEEINRLNAEHRRYAQRLDELVQKPYLSADEQLEEVRLKKLKLHAKDLIVALENQLPAICVSSRPQVDAEGFAQRQLDGCASGDCAP